jgi:hypothetical protein
MNEVDLTIVTGSKEIKLTEKQELRFWGKVNKLAGSDACWLWMAGKFRRGYGAFHVSGKLLKAHRIAYTLANGQIPKDICVCHRCDVTSCCNPNHLFLGTHAENSADMVIKGRSRSPRGDANGARLHPERLVRGDAHHSRRHPERMPRGESHVLAKITADSVIKIRALYSTGEITQAALASKFGLSRQHIGSITTFKKWKHLKTGGLKRA